MLGCRASISRMVWSIAVVIAASASRFWLRYSASSSFNPSSRRAAMLTSTSSRLIWQVCVRHLDKEILLQPSDVGRC